MSLSYSSNDRECQRNENMQMSSEDASIVCALNEYFIYFLHFLFTNINYHILMRVKCIYFIQHHAFYICDLNSPILRLLVLSLLYV